MITSTATAASSISSAKQAFADLRTRIGDQRYFAELALFNVKHSLLHHTAPGRASGNESRWLDRHAPRRALPNQTDVFLVMPIREWSEK